MILTHKTGVLLHGTLAKDPVFKDVGQKQVLKFDVKAHSVKTDTGSWESLYVQVNVWHGLDKWDGMLLKGDAVTVFARELKTRGIQRQDLLQCGCRRHSARRTGALPVDAESH
mgnify:CR=1 FL=1